MRRSHGSPAAGVSSRRGRSQRSPAGPGIPSGVARSFGRGILGTLWLPSRLAEYRRQFGRASRRPGDDPSVFAIELETLARWMFADINASVRLQLIQDKFIVGQAECFLRRTVSGQTL